MSKEKFNKSTLFDIFNNLFCKSLPITSLTISAFECFKTQFFIINFQEKNLELKAGQFSSRISQSLIGLDYLYQIVITSPNQEISHSAGSFLVTLYLKLSKAAFLAKNELWVEFINNILTFIENDRKNSEIITKSLKTLQLFLEEDCSAGSVGLNKLMNYYYKSPVDKEYQKLTCNGTDTLRTIRKRFAEIFKKPLPCISVRIDSTVYDSSNDNIYMSPLRSNVIIVDFVTPKVGELSPKEFLAKHQQLQDLLFSLLSDPTNSYCSEA